MPRPAQLRARLGLRRAAALPVILRRSAAQGSAPRKSFGGGEPWRARGIGLCELLLDSTRERAATTCA